MVATKHDYTGEPGHLSVEQIDTVGWGIFFLWIGIALAAGLGWGVGLLGVGIIMLAVQMWRQYFKVPLQVFGLVLGSLFALAGLWDLLKERLGHEPIPGGLIPILSMIVGVALLVSALLRKRG